MMPTTSELTFSPWLSSDARPVADPGRRSAPKHHAGGEGEDKCVARNLRRWSVSSSGCLSRTCCDHDVANAPLPRTWARIRPAVYMRLTEAKRYSAGGREFVAHVVAEPARTCGASTQAAGERVAGVE